MSPLDQKLLLPILKLFPRRRRRKRKVGTKQLVAVDVEREGKKTLGRLRKSCPSSELRGIKTETEGNEGREGRKVERRRDGSARSRTSLSLLDKIRSREASFTHRKY